MEPNLENESKNWYKRLPEVIKRLKGGQELTEADRKSLLEYIEFTLEELVGQVAQTCTVRDEHGNTSLDSMAISSNTSAMELLEQLGKLTITKKLSPRWVKGVWKT